MTERAAPFHCPYCAEEDLRPFGETHGQWRCGACQRVFALKYLGIAADWRSQPAPETGIAADWRSQPAPETGIAADWRSQPVSGEPS